LRTMQEWNVRVKVAGGRQVLAGRTEELEAVVGLVRQSIDGVAGTLLVTGEAGAGKTALLRESASRMSSSVEVVWATCLPLSSLSVPFLPLTSAVLHRAGGPEQLRVLALSPDNAPAAFDGWLDALCDRRPVVLVIDDLQWADQSSLDVLLYVLAGPENRHLAVVMSVRCGEEGLILPEWLANVRRLPRTSELRLGPLDRLGVQDQLTGLLGRTPHQSLVDQVHARTSGNPYLTELLVRGLSADATSLPVDMPTELRDAVTRRWQRLTPNAKALTRLLAITGRPQRGEDLMRLAQPAGVHGDVVRPLREAVDSRIVEVGPDGTYWFAHPLLPEVLEQGLLPEERQALHATLARSLDATNDTHAEPGVGIAVALADHHAGAGHSQDAFRWAMIAADSAQQSGGHAEALRLLLRALALWPNATTTGLTKVDMLRRVQSAAHRSGNPDAELDVIGQLLHLTDPIAEPLLVSELLIRTVGLEDETWKAHADPGAAGLAVRLSAAYPDSPQHAVAVARLAEQEVWDGLPSGRQRAEDAVRLARRSGSARALANALSARVMARVLAGEGDALDDALEAETTAATARDFLAYVSAVSWSCNCIDIGPTSAEATAHCARGREQLVAMGAPHRYVALLCAQEAHALLMSGDWRACVSRLRVALGSTPGPRPDAIARLTAALLDVRQGRWQQAEEHLARAAEVAGGYYEFFGYHAIRAELHIVKGDHRAGFDAAMSGVEAGRANLREHLLPLATRALANEAQALRDRGEDAGPVLTVIRELVTKYPANISETGPGPAHAAEVTAMQAMYEAEVARAHHRSDAAARWRQAASACADARLRWDEAYACWRSAETGLQSTALRETARSDLRRAHHLATELAATPLLNEIEALAHEARIPLSSSGPVEASVPIALPNLTQRERDILVLVMAGRTYAEMARELVISEKTVSSHVSNMLRKTDTSSRIELAQLARRLSANAEQT
jgi:DNA-binding CsgD family transcriptional regulator